MPKTIPTRNHFAVCKKGKVKGKKGIPGLGFANWLTAGIVFYRRSRKAVSLGNWVACAYDQVTKTRRAKRPGGRGSYDRVANTTVRIPSRLPRN